MRNADKSENKYILHIVPKKSSSSFTHKIERGYFKVNPFRLCFKVRYSRGSICTEGRF